jgi:hypothetical protein
MYTNMPLWSYLAQLFLEWETFQAKFVENINTYISLFRNFFSPENHVVYEIMRTKFVEAGVPSMTIWRMCIACWILKDTKTHSEYVIIIALPLQQWLHERASLLHYTYIACLFDL